MECWFNGSLQLKKGDIVKITRAFPNKLPIRVTVIENVTQGLTQRSRDEGVVMTESPEDCEIVGRVLASTFIGGNNVTNFAIEKGVMTPDHVFVKAGEVQKGQDALVNILKNELDAYVKIFDPYISPTTINLLANVPNGIRILIITDNITDLVQTKAEASKLSNKITIKKRSGFHDRYILTSGKGWSVGHSLKDFGTKASSILKLESSGDIESHFDDEWHHAVPIC